MQLRHRYGLWLISDDRVRCQSSVAARTCSDPLRQVSWGQTGYHVNVKGDFSCRGLASDGYTEYRRTGRGREGIKRIRK